MNSSTFPRGIEIPTDRFFSPIAPVLLVVIMNLVPALDQGEALARVMADPGTVPAIPVDAADPNLIYAATAAAGVLRATGNGATWTVRWAGTFAGEEEAGSTKTYRIGNSEQVLMDLSDVGNNSGLAGSSRANPDNSLTKPALIRQAE